MLLPKDILSGTYRKPDVYLCEIDKSKICKLETSNTSGSFKFNAYSELTFDVARVYNNAITGQTQVNPYYNKIEAFRLILLDGFGYFELQDPEIESDGIKEAKSLTAYSLEYTLSQKHLEKFYVNTGKVDSVEVLYMEEHGNSVVIPVTLYNPKIPELSLLHLILEKVYGWKIGHVDVSLQTMSRQFEIDRMSVYDFIMNEICDKFNCYAVFDTVNNTINFYAEALTNRFIGDGSTKTFTISPAFVELGTVSIDGYKTTSYTYDAFTGVLTLDNAPESGAMIEVTDGSLSSWETDVYVTFDNLAQQMGVSYESDNIKTVLTVKGADDLDIREVNNGLPYIIDLSYFYNVDWMGQDLYDAYTLYLSKCAQYQSEYKSNAQEIIELSNKISYETNRLSLQYSEASVFVDTVGTYYIRGGDADSGYYYTEVSLPGDYIAGTTYYSIDTTDLTEEKVSDLYEALKIYYSTGETTGFTDEETQLSDSFSFMEDNTISDLVSILNSTNVSNVNKDNAVLAFFDEMWYQLGLTPLETLYLAPYKEVQTANVSAGWANKDNNNYGLYYPVVLILQSLEKAIAARKVTIDELTKSMTEYSTRNVEIGNELLIDNNFTDDQLIRLSAFLREDEYTDNNFVATGNESTAELFQLKQELLECGRIELSKLCEPCLKFSMSLANIYALPEFEPIVNQFQLGNLIKIALRPDYIKHTRLMQVDLNFEDFSDFSCEFGDLMSIRSQTDLHADLLSQAVSAGKTVASNASYWSKGSDQATSIDLKIQNGLLDAVDSLKSMDGTQYVDISKYGIKLQDIDPTTGEIDPHQTWMVNNKILMSSDGFKTARLGLGQFNINGQDEYGMMADFMIAGYIEGSTIKGGTIDIGNGTFVVDSDGSVTMKASSIDGYITSDGLSSAISATEKSIESKVSKGEIISTINQSAESVTINANKISLAGKEIGLTSDNITIESTNFSVTKEGNVTAKNITATGGTIGGWEITNKSLIHRNSDNTPKVIISGTGSQSNNYTVGTHTGKNWSIWSNSKFGITNAGKLYATDAEITGNITANSLTLGSNVTVPYSKVSGTPDLSVYIAKDGTVGSTPGDGKTGFKVSKAGLLTASNAVIYGDIYASGGTIAGWTISKTKIYGTYSGKVAAIQLPTSSTTYVFAAGGTSHDNYGDCPFRVTKAGKLYATDAEIKGKITATSGEFAGSLKGASGTFTKLTAGTASDGLVTVNQYGIKIGKTSTGYALIGDPDYTEDNTGQEWTEITIRPSAHEIGNIGTTDRAWDTLTVRMAWIRDGVSQSSDRNVKKDIVPMDDVQEQLFNELKPVTFKFTNGTSGRTHYGFVSQDVEDTLHNMGLTGTDFAGFCKDTYINENNEEVTKYSLRYSEFVALNTHMIQKLKKEILELKKEILELKKEIQELKEINVGTGSNNAE